MSLEPQIVRLRSRHSLQVLKLSTIRITWLFFAFVLALVFSDMAFQWSDTPRFVLEMVALLSLPVVALIAFHLHTRAASRGRMIARLVEQGNPDLRNDLVSAIDFEETLSLGKETSVSQELMRHQILIADEKVTSLRQLEALKPPGLRVERNVLVGFIAITLLLAATCSGIFRAVLPRYLDPWGDHPPYCPTQLALNPLKATVDYGQSLKISVNTKGPQPRDISLVIMDARGREVSTLPMFEESPGAYFQTIEQVQDDLVCYARIPGGRSKRAPITVTPWPRIQSTTIACEHPSYTRLRPETTHLTDEGIRAYADSRVTLTVMSNRPLKGGTLMVCGKSYPLTPTDPHSVNATFPLTTSGDFAGIITDGEGHASHDRLSGKIEILPDLKPSILFVTPGVDSFATPSAKVPLNVEASDDLGIKRVEFIRNLNHSDDARKCLPMGEGSVKYANLLETLDMANLGVKPGDMIEYHAVAYDTNPVQAGSAATSVFRLSIIADEQYKLLMQQQTRAEDLREKYDELLQKMEELARQQQELEKHTAELNESFPKEITPEQQAQLDRILKERQKIEKHLEPLKNNLPKEGSPAPDQLAKMDSLMKDLQELAKREEELRKGIPKTSPPSPAQVAQMERLSSEQQELARQTEELAKDFKDESKTPAIFDIEEDYKKALEKFSNQLSKAGEKMKSGGHDLKKASKCENCQSAGSSISSSNKSQKEALAELNKSSDEFKDGIGKASNEISRMAALQEDVERFKQLLGRQKALEQQSHAMKDSKNPSLDDRGRLMELAAEQSAVGRELQELKEDFKQHADAVEKSHPKACKDARSIASQIDSRNIGKMINDAAGSMEAGKPIPGYANARSAHDQMMEMVSICENSSAGGRKECEDGLKITMNMSMGNTFEQLAKSMKSGGIGGAGRGSAGQGGGQTPFGVFGSEQNRDKNRRSSGGGRRDTVAKSMAGRPESIAPSVEELNTHKNKDLEVKGGGGQRYIEEYKKLIEQYFKRMAEE